MAEPGSVIFEKYEILKLIGRGGMSRVYLAMDTRLNKQWVIKEVDRRGRSRKTRACADAVLAEAALMKKLDHPALPRIVDILETDKLFYIVMDYIEGENLDSILKQKGPLSPGQVRIWSEQLAQVLDYLHSLDPPVIYRDLKPANVIISPTGNVRLIDFGIAREYKAGKARDTCILGTPGYAAPEQNGWQQTDARSDIFSLGMTMYSMLTARKPPGIRQQAGIDRRIPEEFAVIIRRCTMIDPDRRYQSCGELLQDLENSSKLTAAYRKGQTHHFILFLISILLSAGCMLAGSGCRIRADSLKKSHYENLISIVSTTDTEQRRKNYLEAAELFPDRTEACSRLLDAYQEDGAFTPEESRELIALINRRQDRLQTDRDTAAFFERIGTLYLNFYQEKDGTYSFADRVRRASPFFVEADTLRMGGNAEGKNDSGVSVFSRICRFYSDFVLDSSYEEGGRQDYADLTDSLEQELAKQDGRELYSRLCLDDTVLLLVYDQRVNLQKSGIEEEQVLGLLDRAREDAEEVWAGRKASRQLREEILSNYDDFRDAVERAYRKPAGF